jgi:carboxypeptidase family protein
VVISFRPEKFPKACYNFGFLVLMKHGDSVLIDLNMNGRIAARAIMTTRVLLRLILVTFLGSLELQAQSVRAVLTGFVTDPSKAPVSDVVLTLTQKETNKRRITMSDSQGEFLISLLPAGAYQLEAERKGYKKFIQEIALQVDQELRVEIPLLIGDLSEEVVVTAKRGLLRTDSAALGAVIENRQITGLPLNGRNFFELSLLIPGAAPAAPGSAGSVRGDFAMNINGSREDSNQFLLDGIYNGDPKLNGVGVSVPVDAVREFELLTSAYDASFGRNAGGQVNVILKSGSNQIHGTAYEFFRNAALDGRNFFAAPNEPAPQYQRNQFGVSLGGPVKKDRTFYFADYEGRRVREGISRTSNVPTLLERSGDFSQSILPAPIDPFTRQPFRDGKIPTDRLNPIGVAIAKLYPEPNRLVPLQNFVSSPALRDRDDHFDGRIDHSLAKSSDLSVRYSFADRDLFEPFSGPLFATIPGFGTNVPRRAQNVLVSETHTFSSVFLNELRLGFNRVSGGALHENQGMSLNQRVGLPELSSNPRDFGLSYITVTGFSPLGDEYNNPQQSATNIFQWIDHATYSRGRHLLKFGVDIRKLQQNAFRDVQSRGLINFLGFSGNPLAELLLGFPSLSGGGAPGQSSAPQIRKLPPLFSRHLSHPAQSDPVRRSTLRV